MGDVSEPRRRTILIISQVYVPDPASVGQHMHDAAAEMARRGHRVVVLTSNRGYDDPSRKYPSRETRDGVEIRRLRLSSFGKKRLWLRFVAAWLFVLQCTVRGLFRWRLDTLLVSTSPPMAPFAGVVIGWFRRRLRVVFWCMDLNIDLLVAMGQAKRSSRVVRFFGWMERSILRRADHVVALDRYMAEKLNAKHDVSQKMTVSPPWPHEDHIAPVEHDENPFRREHGLAKRFVIMFSGNLSVAADVDTILAAALELKDEPRLLLMFIGGGLGKKRVEQVISEHRPGNIVSLPYQPLEKLRFSLSAADVHLVSVGDVLVGLSHPCKVYGSMAVARPILLLGPTPSHVSDILDAHACGWRIAHGDVEGAVRTFRQILRTPPDELCEMGSRARRAVRDHFGMKRLRDTFCDLLVDGN
jgi:glycosyltransferase involved in cell wall biosynthesis